MTNNPSKPSASEWFLKFALPPLAIIVIALLLAVLALKFKPSPEKKEQIKRLPSIEVFYASAQSIQITVESQGSAQPRTETTLVAEVGGRVTYISPSLYAGGRFKAGDVLAKIDPIDYQAALAAAEARLADAELVLEQERALAQQAEEDWKLINDREATSLALRAPQLKRAEASYHSAVAAIEVAKRDLDRTTIKAPYDGISREKLIDIGQIATPRTTAIGRIYGTDIAEVRLPISLDELAYLPDQYGEALKTLKVELHGDYAGKTEIWIANVDRVEGVIDQRTRMAYVVAQVTDPYDQSNGKAPLPAGLFVRAYIEGQKLGNAFMLPRKAVKGKSSAYIVKEDNTIEIRPIEIYQATEKTVVVLDELEDGERLCLTELQYAVNGMEVAIKE